MKIQSKSFLPILVLLKHLIITMVETPNGDGKTVPPTHHKVANGDGKTTNNAPDTQQPTIRSAHKISYINRTYDSSVFVATNRCSRPAWFCPVFPRHTGQPYWHWFQCHPCLCHCTFQPFRSQQRSALCSPRSEKLWLDWNGCFGLYLFTHFTCTIQTNPPTVV